MNEEGWSLKGYYIDEWPGEVAAVLNERESLEKKMRNLARGLIFQIYEKMRTTAGARW